MEKNFNQESDPNRGKPLLMVVDDMPSARLIVRQVFSDAYRIVEADDGAHALELIEQQRPDLIITDLEMPRLDGFGLCEKLMEDQALSHIPVVILSRYGEEENRVRGIRLGAMDFVSKPFNMRELRARVEQTLDRDRGRRELRDKLHGYESELLQKDAMLAMSMEELVEKTLDLQENLRRTDELNRQLVEKEQALEEKNQALKRALAAKAEFISLMSHELKTPLVPILGYSEMIITEGPNLAPEEALDFAEKINQSGQALKGLIDDLLLLARKDAGREQLYFELVSMGVVIDELICRVEARDYEKPVSVTWSGPGFELIADKVKLNRALMKIVENSIKFSGDKAEIRITAAVEGGTGFVELADAGPGMDERHLPHVFDRFYQGEPADTRRHKGAGLGLAVAREVIESMGGRIAAASPEGSGAVFTLFFPLARDGEKIADD